MAHWQAIIINACEQCGRNHLPDLSFTATLQECLQTTPTETNKILLDFDGSPFNKLKKEFNTGQLISVLIGPEGGFNGEEIQQAKDAGFKACLLGPRILRMETAAISMIAIVQQQFGDMD